jgi:hypothetical protein
MFPRKHPQKLHEVRSAFWTADPIQRQTSRSVIPLESLFQAGNVDLFHTHHRSVRSVGCFTIFRAYYRF